jgi:hypothetical protein
MEFQRHSQPFECLGVQLSRPVDSLGEKKYAILRNVRAYADGTIHPRRGLSQPSAFMESPVHSIKRFYDSFTNTEDEITGGGTKLYMGGVQVDTGYSGNPLSFVPHRPSSTPEAYVYIADSLKLRKVVHLLTCRLVQLSQPPLIQLLKILRVYLMDGYREVLRGL